MLATSRTKKRSTKKRRSNKQLLEMFIESIRSEVTRPHAIALLNAYCRHYLMVDENGQPQYVQLMEEPEDIQEKIVHFVIHKKKRGLGASGIESYINKLVGFYSVNGIKNIDWDTVRKYKPDNVKKTSDREYFDEEVIKLESKLDDRGKVVSGVIRGSGIRRGGEPTVRIKNLFPRMTKYGKIYKIWVYWGTSAQYPTACIPEVAAKMDIYSEYRMRFGELCPQFGREHSHEYHDGPDNVVVVTYRADEKHLDPEAPLIRDQFNKRSKEDAMNPQSVSDGNISDIVRDALIEAGLRVVNKGDPYKRHKIMVTHGLRKLFKKRCRQSGMDRILIERFMGHRGGNPKEGITQLMMTYDPEDWEEMEQEFIKAIPHLTITKDAKIQAELEKTRKEVEQKEQEKTQLQAEFTQMFDVQQKRFDAQQKRLEALEAKVSAAHH